MSRSPRITDITTLADLEARIAAGPTLVDLWADWCSPCRAIAPIIDTFAERFAGRIDVIAVDVDAAPEIAERYGVRSIPTLIYFPGGGMTPRRFTGLADAARIHEALGLPADAG